VLITKTFYPPAFWKGRRHVQHLHNVGGAERNPLGRQLKNVLLKKYRLRPGS